MTLSFSPDDIRQKAVITESKVLIGRKLDALFLIQTLNNYLDNAVLMMAWMKRESIQRTLETGEACYWSRSRAELWHKGATSGHIQKVKAFYYDCDADTLLLKIEQVGNVACHTGARSCFFKTVSLSGSILAN